MEDTEKLNMVDAFPFIIEIGALGKFRRNNGDVYWTYTPHLTMGRSVQVKENFDLNSFSKEISKITIEIHKISLVLSHRLDNKLTYTPIKVCRLAG